MIDDEKIIRLSVRRVLEPTGFVVVSFSRYKEGMEYYKSNSPDLVLLDLKMPQIPGTEFFKLRRKLDRKTPVIVFTGHPNSKYMKQILEYPPITTLIGRAPKSGGQFHHPHALHKFKWNLR